jgi:hypothetical protein
MMVETENDVSIHQEVKEHVHYKNLACMPEREQIEENDGQFLLWLRCRFDLNEASTVSKATFNDVDYETMKQTSVVRDRFVRPSGGTIESSSTTNLNINAVPPCDEILISGQRPRVIRCSSNPMKLVITGDDKTAIVRAKGYQPKTIELITGGNSYEAIQVILEAN